MEDYLPVGPGFATYVNGDEYWGSYYDGKRNSYGRYTFMETGAIYEGNYTNNLKHGFGTMTYPDHSVYIGSWFCHAHLQCFRHCIHSRALEVCVCS